MWRQAGPASQSERRCRAGDRAVPHLPAAGSAPSRTTTSAEAQRPGVRGGGRRHPGTRSAADGYLLAQYRRRRPAVYRRHRAHQLHLDPINTRGGRFVYLSKYMEPDHPYFTMPDDEIIAIVPAPPEAHQSGRSIRSWVKNTWVFRERAAQPIIPMRYSERIPALRTPLARLYLANTTQIYPEDRGTNYSVRLGERCRRAHPRRPRPHRSAS